VDEDDRDGTRIVKNKGIFFNLGEPEGIYWLII